MEYIFVGLGGIMGAICRYLVSLMIAPVNFTSFPYETLTANLIGCFTLSFISFSIPSLYKLNNNIRLAITTGFLGSFTTFSTFSLEMVKLINANNYILAVVYLIASLLGGLALAALGMNAAIRLKNKIMESE